MNSLLESHVRQRAQGRCEYCRLPQAASNINFPIDHIIARQHGGETVEANLALSCAHCNLHKGPNIAGLDPIGQGLTPLYHPRRDHWSDHFAWDGSSLIGRTAIGRTTIYVLAINDASELVRRDALILEGVFPVTDRT